MHIFQMKPLTHVLSDSSRICRSLDDVRAECEEVQVFFILLYSFQVFANLILAGSCIHKDFDIISQVHFCVGFWLRANQIVFVYRDIALWTTSQSNLTMTVLEFPVTRTHTGTGTGRFPHMSGIAEATSARIYSQQQPLLHVKFHYVKSSLSTNHILP